MLLSDMRLSELKLSLNEVLRSFKTLGSVFLYHLMMLHCSLSRNSKICVCVCFLIVCVCSVTQLCPTLCECMVCSNFPGKNLRVIGHFILQGIFPTQGLNLSLLHCQAVSLQQSHLGSLFWFYLLVFPNMFAAKLLLKNRASSQFLF